MEGITVKILPVELSNNEPDDIVQKSVTTSHVRLYVTSVTANYSFATGSAPQQTTNEFEIPQGDHQNGKDSLKELQYSQPVDIQESADIEEPNVHSTENEEPTKLVNAEVEIILERSTTKSRDVPTLAASLFNPTLSTTNKSTPLSSTMPPPPPQAGRARYEILRT
ncbi:hypothetical protein K3495_g1970 [Podosphaera aphanis]|nr:hypothetical protein K3495_g1970 [Podosphaera aphanis]